MIRRGTLLLAEPFLGDHNFERSVILICEHSSEGTFGLVLNKPTDFQLCDVVDVDLNFQIFIGGPVDKNTLHYIYRDFLSVQNTVKLKDGLCWGGDFEELKASLTGYTNEHQYVRFFVGYSGWAAGQLDDEIKAKSWIIYNGDIKDILQIPPKDMWRTILKKMGGVFKLYANYPVDPRLN